MNADDAAVKESRRVLRLIHEHLARAHLNLGAKQEHVGLVEVIYHPTSKLPHLNYVMPRRNTAWIPGPQVESGLARLRDRQRTPRVMYVEGLFPPLFSRTLIDLGLSVEQETAIMVYALDDADRIDAIKPRPMPDGVSLRFVDDQEGIGMWWYVWRNAHYEVLTHGVEPIYIGLDVRAITLGQQYDLVLSRFGFPIGVARITLNDETAHLTSLAIMQEFRASDLTRLLIHTALTTAKERGCSLVFTTGDGDEERRFYREIGFVDFGSIVCYSELGGSLREESRDLAQPVFALY